MVVMIDDTRGERRGVLVTQWSFQYLNRKLPDKSLCHFDSSDILESDFTHFEYNRVFMILM
jgi:hypothetical protein